MGLGGHLMWTAVGREICNKNKNIKVIPVKKEFNNYSVVHCEIFKNNNNFIQSNKIENLNVFPLIFNNHSTNYCKKDTPEKAYHRYDKHIIEQICEFYNIENPTLKCDLFLTDKENEEVKNITKFLSKDFIVIEPSSKNSYTVNRNYSFEKYQKIVDTISKDIEIVQIGNKNSKLLDNVTDIRGKTSFRTAVGAISKSKLFVSTEGGLVHGATSTSTKSLVIITGYQSSKMISYPQNINIDISSHGPCGLKKECFDCKKDLKNHNYTDIINKILKEI